MVDEMKRIRDELRSKGYKLTPQRSATLDIIFQNEGKHMSTEEIYNLVKKQCPEIGLATVYRTLQLLEEMDIIYRQNFDDGRNRYELNCRNEDHHHHHLICLECGSVTEVKGDLLEKLENNIEKGLSFKIMDHRLKFFGYCKSCWENRDESMEEKR
ncbi:MAG: Fur family transcriptional regulator [Clostridia bacterium]